MIYGIYSMRDIKGVYSSPTVDYTDDSAKRNFAFAVNNSGSIMGFAPADFQLFKIGEFDSEKGSIIPVVPVQFIVDGASVKEV